MIEISKKNFEEEVTKSEKPVLVDFWASWCGPCRMVAPILEEIAAEQEEVKVCKLNVDNEGELAESFGIMSIPTLILFKEGKAAGKLVGARPKEEILNFIKK